MPRDLTDLFEDAVRAAPPEPHLAGDITRLAERRQSRRTTLVAGAAALAVVAVAGGAFGLTRSHDSAPQPAGRYQHDQTVDATSAVPASALPGYRLEPWTIPSVQHFGAGYGPLPTYQQIDAEGRLIVGDAPGGKPQRPVRIRLFDGPGEPARALRQPPSPGSNDGQRITWVPSFLADGRLLWRPSSPIVQSADVGIHLTDINGGHDVFVPSHFRIAHRSFQDVTRPWVSGNRLWFTGYDGGTIKGGLSHSLYTASFSGAVTKVADKVAVADVADGLVGWVTMDGEVMTENAAGGPQHRVSVPLTPGCRMPATLDLQNGGANPLAVSRSVIALAESCGAGADQRREILAFDTTGNLLVHVTGVYGFDPSLGQDDLVFQGLVPRALKKAENFRYDLVDGTLATLGPGTKTSSQAPQAAGDYILWYDGRGGHVAELAD